MGRRGQRAAASELVGAPGSGANETSVLFVCTANQCRSPFAEAIARRRAWGEPIVFASGGLIDGGRPMPAAGVEVAAELGMDLSAHRSRRLDLGGLRGWDVILTMAREHERELIAADDELWPRVFTVKQFRRWIDAHPRPRRAGLGTWIDAAASERSRFEVVGADPDDDIEDPLHSPHEAWRQMAATLDEEIGAILHGLGRTRAERPL